jgi:hypothetical protein
MLDVTDVKPALPAVKNPAPAKGPCLNDLIAIARDAHLGVISAFSNALDRAIACGRALNQMDKAGLVPHGGWDRVYKRCELGERQALRYKKLARLLEEKPTLKSVLTGLSIEQALKKLAPPKPRAGSGGKTERSPRQHAPTTPAQRATFADILAAWMAAPAAERTRAIDAIGWSGLRAAIPQTWNAVVATPMIDVTPATPASAPTVSDELPIPNFLGRKAK